MRVALVYLLLSSFLYAQSKLRLAAAGDLMCHDSQLNSAWQSQTQSYHFHGSFQPIKSTLEQADLALANLETTLPGKDFAGYPRFGTPDSFAEALFGVGFRLLVTANNHSVDRGIEGLQRTLDVLDRIGFAHTGTFRHAEEREKSPYLSLTKNGIKVAFLNYSYGTNGLPAPAGTVNFPLRKKQISEDIARARLDESDFIIVYYHFGNEYERHPNPTQREYAYFALDEGAHVVLGSHPHVIQPYELLQWEDRYGEKRERLIAYSLGNFISGQTKPYTSTGLLLFFTLVKESKKIENVLPKLVYTLPSEGQFYVYPLPELFSTKIFHRLPRKKQKQIKREYQEMSVHVQSYVNGRSLRERSLPE
ncbi:MAG: CapA family protein [Leptospiraceae bacterium]|nr:CapA family protein [Leptospiraceae bacterium]MDW8306724.1 CapA family protein [Leptospiraceae bacterium]